jgi:adenosylmethionine-8-amino-7-oxononanoate aminotransferase
MMTSTTSNQANVTATLSIVAFDTANGGNDVESKSHSIEASSSLSAKHRTALVDSPNSVASFDRRHVIHPYGMINSEEGKELFPEVLSAEGTKLTLQDGRVVVDGLSSWWACVHGYRRKELDAALVAQAQNKMSHVMFGGLTHRPACELTARILDIVPQTSIEDRKLSKVFLCDSGSVAVEVAMKMALQYWESQQRKEEHGSSTSGTTILRKERFLTTRSGYHGDTFLPMSVSDPVNGMHHLIHGVLAKQVFISAPSCRENGCTTKECKCNTAKEMREALAVDNQIAGVIIEPIFQGAGAMKFYSPALLIEMRKICDEFGVPLILDEIATGFGRTGKLFAANHSGIVPDIMCIGKALTGGYMTMGATIVSARIAKGITTPLMHGPTFMANPLACAVACASIDLLLSSPWKDRVKKVESLLESGLKSIRKEFATVVADVRVFGAIGVIEFHQNLTVESKRAMTETLLKNGVWLRPFANFLYTMPPFNSPLDDEEVKLICSAMREAVIVMGQYSTATPIISSAKRSKIDEKDPETFV